MTAFVVFTHPCAESFASAVLERVVSGLHSNFATVEVADLYTDGYQPGSVLPTSHRTALDRASTLVLVYPTWWSAQPAILLGWLIAAAESGLPSINTLVCVTTHGGGRLTNRLAGRAGRNTAERVVRSRCAPRARFHWLGCYGLDTSSENQRVEFLDRVERVLGSISVRELH